MSDNGLYFNPAAFIQTPQFAFANVSRYLPDASAPRDRNWELLIEKVTRIRECYHLTFRAELFNIFNGTQFRIYDPDNAGGTGNNVVSCYAGPLYSAGFQSAGGADCITGASFLHQLNAHRARTMQFGLKWAF